MGDLAEGDVPHRTNHPSLHPCSVRVPCRRERITDQRLVAAFAARRKTGADSCAFPYCWAQNKGAIMKLDEDLKEHFVVYDQAEKPETQPPPPSKNPATEYQRPRCGPPSYALRGRQQGQAIVKR